MPITNESFVIGFCSIKRALCILDLETGELVGNKLFTELLGLNFQPEDLYYKTQWSSLFVGENITNLKPGMHYQLKVSAETWSSQVNKDASYNVIFEELENRLLLGFLEDHEAREHEFHSQRLKTLGTLAGTIAHDFNNVLTGLLGHITFLKTILPASGQHVESLYAIEEGSRKAAELTQQILSFSKLKVAEQHTVVDLKELIQKTAALLKGAVTARHQLELILPERAVMVHGVEGKLAQILINLVMNAKAALEQSGFIRVMLDVSVGEGAGTFATLKVIDNGCGIPEKTLNKVFEPFFSTRSNGTGLGLATVDRLVRELNGTITIQSKVDFGTTITVQFPMLSEDQRVVQPEKIVLEKGTERILIIDDEDSVRNVLAVSLKHLGYNVTMVASGREALDKFMESNQGYDLVLLDMLMPQLSGEETFFALKELKSTIKVLIISGYASDEAIQTVLNAGAYGFIQKPFTIEDLSVKVRACLDDRAGKINDSN